MLGHRRGHFRIQRRQDLFVQLDQRDGDAAADEAFGHFQADETGADDDRPPPAAVQRRLDAVRVMEISQGEDAGQIGAGDRQARRGGAGGQNQLVVGLAIDPAGGQIADNDALARPVDRLDLALRPHVQFEPLAEPLGRDDQQLAAIGDLAAEVVGQAAIGKRDVRSSLEEDDFGVFRKASRPGGSRRAARHASDNKQLHDWHGSGVKGVKGIPSACKKLYERVWHSQEEPVFAVTRFHGIRANNIPMPQVSVIPAKIKPAPTKAASAEQAGWTSQPSTAPNRTSEPAVMRTCRSKAKGFLAADHGQAGGGPGQRSAFDVDDVNAARGRQLFARLLAASARAADHIERLPGVRPAPQQSRRIERVQRDVAGKIGMHLAELRRGANVDQLHRLTAQPQGLQIHGGNGCNVHGSLLVLAKRWRMQARNSLKHGSHTR